VAGFEFKETMAGTWRSSAGGGERNIEFTITARAGRLLRHLFDRKAEMDGRLRMAGFAEDVPLSGELIIDPILGKRIRYEFDFVADDGKRYHFAGQKDVRFLDVVRTMTTLPAEIKGSDGEVVARCDLKFDTNDLPKFLGSFRGLLNP
jgi:hypothetical protein